MEIVLNLLEYMLMVSICCTQINAIDIVLVNLPYSPMLFL